MATSSRSPAPILARDGNLGLQSAAVVPNLDGTLSLDMPAQGSGTVPVVITTPYGSITFDYTYYDAPTITSISPESGPTTGAAVIVSGAGFDAPGLLVTAAGTPVTPDVTATSLSFTMPAHASGGVNVVVMTDGGQATDSYTYVDAPTLTLMDVTVPLGGGSISIEGQHLLGATATLDRLPLTIESSDATQLNTTLPTHGVGVATLILQTPGGTATLTVHYSAAPVLLMATSSLIDTAFPTTTISGESLADPTGVSIDGLPVAVFASTASSITVVAPSLPLGRYDVIVHTAGGSATAADLYAVTEHSAINLSTDTTKLGDALTIAVRGFNPLSAVTVTLHSTPVNLGTFRIGADGRRTLTVAIPMDTEAGSHVITVSGIDVDGAPLTVDASLEVASGATVPVTPAAAAALSVPVITPSAAAPAAPVSTPVPAVPVARVSSHAGPVPATPVAKGYPVRKPTAAGPISKGHPGSGLAQTVGLDLLVGLAVLALVLVGWKRRKRS